MGNQVLLFDSSGRADASLSGQLAQCGLAVEAATDIASAARWLRTHDPACVVARVSDAEAAELCGSLRRLTRAPLAALCTERDESLVVRCLEAGADTVLLAPLSRRELAARIGALLARQNGSRPAESPAQVYHIADLVIDTEAHTVTRAGLPVSLTPTEFRLLVALARRAGDAVSHEELLSEVWGAGGDESAENLRLYVRYLRQKLGDDQAQPRLLLSQRGIGYRLAWDATERNEKGSAHGQHKPELRSAHAGTRSPVRARLPLATGGS